MLVFLVLSIATMGKLAQKNADKLTAWAVEKWGPQLMKKMMGGGASVGAKSGSSSSRRSSSSSS
jgi:hypothetical protein